MSVLGPIGVSGLNHLFEHIFMMQMIFPSISGFDSASRAHFRSESVMRFIYFNNNKHFVTMEWVCWAQ